MGKNLSRFAAMCLCAIVAATSIPIDAFAATFTRRGNIIQVGGNLYYENDTGGAKAYIPINIARDGDNMRSLAGMFSLPEMQGGSGSWANEAAFQYSGFSAYAGSNSRYLAKTTAAKSRPYQHDLWIKPPYYRYNGNELFSFRYAGMVQTGDQTVMAGTNPDFPSDTISMTGVNGGQPTTAQRYSRKVNSANGMEYTPDSVQVYGSASAVHNLDRIYTNGYKGSSFYTAKGNIKSNKVSSINQSPALAKQAFEKWFASEDGFGEAYRQKAINLKQGAGAAKYGNMEEWEILNHFFQISGDPQDDDGTVYFYMVSTTETGHDFYNTYATRGHISNNTSPTFFSIRDNEKGQILTESYRTADVMDPANGTGTEVIGPSVQLEYGKYYTLEGILSYYSLKQNASKTSRSVNIFVVGTGAEASAVPIDLGMQPVAGLPSGGALIHKTPTDGKSYGSITPGKNKTHQTDGESATYYYNGAAFANTMFSIPENMPQSGQLLLTVPDAFSENGDNDCQVDDRISIRYTIGTTPPPPPGRSTLTAT